MYETVEKPESAPDESCSVLFDFKATNFEKVEKSEVYAEYQEQEIEADSQFYPILMSKCGYKDIFGFKGRKLR